MLVVCDTYGGMRDVSNIVTRKVNEEKRPDS
jgi:hypothetical protein